MCDGGNDLSFFRINGVAELGVHSSHLKGVMAVFLHFNYGGNAKGQNMSHSRVSVCGSGKGCGDS